MSHEPLAPNTIWRDTCGMCPYVVTAKSRGADIDAAKEHYAFAHPDVEVRYELARVVRRRPQEKAAP